MGIRVWQTRLHSEGMAPEFLWAAEELSQLFSLEEVLSFIKSLEKGSGRPLVGALNTVQCSSAALYRTLGMVFLAALKFLVPCAAIRRLAASFLRMP